MRTRTHTGKTCLFIQQITAYVPRETNDCQLRYIAGIDRLLTIVDNRIVQNEFELRHIYVALLLPDLVKIGWSKNPVHRVRYLSVKTPRMLCAEGQFTLIGTFPGTRLDEQKIHRALRPFLVYRWIVNSPWAEWYRLSDAFLEALPGAGVAIERSAWRIVSPARRVLPKEQNPWAGRFKVRY